MRCRRSSRIFGGVDGVCECLSGAGVYGPCVAPDLDREIDERHEDREAADELSEVCELVEVHR